MLQVLADFYSIQPPLLCVAGEEEFCVKGKSIFVEEGMTSDPDENGRKDLSLAAGKPINAASSGVAADVEPAIAKGGLVGGVPPGEPGRDPPLTGSLEHTRVNRDQARDQQTSGTDADSCLESPSAKRRKVDSVRSSERSTLNQQCRNRNDNSTGVPSDILEGPHQPLEVCTKQGKKEPKIFQDISAAVLSVPGLLAKSEENRASALDGPEEACLQVP